MIVLDENFKVETDAYNYTLKYENKVMVTDPKTKVEREVTQKNEWHFPKLANALDKYVNEALKPCESILQVILKLKELEDIINTQIK